MKNYICICGKLFTRKYKYFAHINVCDKHQEDRKKRFENARALHNELYKEKGGINGY